MTDLTLIVSLFSHNMMLHLPCFNLGRKAMANLDSVFKSRDITLLTKVHVVKGMVFPAVVYVCENWNTKGAEC